MKSSSRPIAIMSGLALLIILNVATAAQAQNREKYVISATAGGINYVSGNVTVQRGGSHPPQELTASDNLKTGESVTTGVGGRVEVLLNPGSYMRVDENSEFELTDASLDSLSVRLIKGSAILEVTGAEGTGLEIAINTPQTDVLIVKRGIYRLNVLQGETTEFSVRKGRALFGKGLLNEVKGGQKVLIGRSRLEVAKLDKKSQDTLDLWSKERAESLAHANRQLQARGLLTAFNDYSSRDMFGIPSWRGAGFWVYSSRFGGFCFIPFGWADWSSPYGFGYSNGFNLTGLGWDGYNWRGSGINVSRGGNGNTGGNGIGGNSGGNNPVTQPGVEPSSRPTRTESPLERGKREYSTQPLPPPQQPN